MNKIILLTIFLFFLLSASKVQNYKVKDVDFISNGVKLSGSIVMPKDKKVKTAVVFVHGSGKQTRSIFWAKKFADKGIATLVYDKRGLGKSGGEYESKQSVSEKNIKLLADDAVTAVEALSEYPDFKGLTLGITGISQAGWIVPIAAGKSDLIKFIVLWSGPVCKVSEEDIFSKYTADLDMKKVPSYHEALNARNEIYIWPDFLGRDTNPVTSLKKLKIPGLWIFGAKDGSVPVDLSIERLDELRELGYPYSYVLFSAEGHNNMSETFSTATDWIIRTVE